MKNIYIELSAGLTVGIKKINVRNYKQYPSEILNNRVIYKDAEPYIWHSIEHIKYNEIIIINTKSIVEFKELLNSFIANILSTDKLKRYIVAGDNGVICHTRMSTKNKIHYLQIEVVPNGKNIYLDKYNCLLISKKLDKIENSCKYF